MGNGNDLRGLIKEISRLSLKKGDVLVFEAHVHNAERMKQLDKAAKAAMKRIGLADVPYLVLSDGIDLEVVSKEESGG